MTSITELPPEILAKILGSCDDFSQLVPFICVCKHFNSVWLANQPTIIWGVATACMYAFDDGLVAVRATALAVEHLKKAELPPQVFPLNSYSGKFKGPSLDELLAVMNMDSRAKTTERLCCTGPLAHRTTPGLAREAPCEYCESLPETFYRALYQSYTIGAVLCTAYYEPLLRKDPSRPPNFLTRFKSYLNGGSRRPFTRSEIEYLLKFPVYRFDSYQECEAIYRPLAEHLVKTGEGKGRGELNDTYIDADRKAFLEMQDCKSELAQCLSYFRKHADVRRAIVLYRKFRQLICVSEVLSNFFKPVYMFLPHEMDSSKRTRKSIVIQYGNFCPEELGPTLSEQQRFSGKWRTVLEIVPPGLDEDSLRMLCMPLDQLLDEFRRHSGQQSFDTSGFNLVDPVLPRPKLRFQFFQFIFGEYLGMQLSDKAIGPGRSWRWDAWINEKRIFSDEYIGRPDYIKRTFERVDDPHGVGTP